MKVNSSIKNIFFIILILININLICSQINDNFASSILEEGEYDLLDTTDYHNMNLIVSTSKLIYTGFPPTKKVETNANLISVSSIITINENYLLAACLEDSFLGKINLSNGNFISLIPYSEISESSALEIPKAICSLSNMDNTIFIGYSKIETIGDEDYVTNIIFQITIKDKDSIEEGPSIDSSKEIQSLYYEQTKKETSSLRQISCEALRITDNLDEFRLICLHESISIYYINDDPHKNYMVFAANIKTDLSGFDLSAKEYTVDSDSRPLGFRIYREDDTHAKIVNGNSLFEIYLETTNVGIRIQDSGFLSNSYDLNAAIDLISYNNLFTFSAQKTSFMGKKVVYSLQINQNQYTNYFKLYNYQDEKVIKILGYYISDEDKIIFIYQTENAIKYFHMDNKVDIYSLASAQKIIKLYSYEATQYDLNELITTPTLSDLGNLNVDYIKYKINTYSSSNEYFGTDFTELLMSDNILIPEPSLNDWKTYYLSFVDHSDNEYTRIYHLKSLTVKIQTCKDGCSSCWDGYNLCTDCSDASYAALIDRDGECFPPTYLVDGYIYDSNSNQFLKCFAGCEFCSEVSTSSTDQKCTSCLSGYLYSYTHPGNCYLYTDLELTDEKEVDESEGLFISSSCSKYKISSTGECVNECPLTTPYFSYEYNEESSTYERKNYNPPKYLFNNICYEQCPENSSPNGNNECICDANFYTDNDGNIFCLSEENCNEDYPYVNQDTKECFNYLEKCNYFFGGICYNTCPRGKVALASQSETIKNYIKEKLSLNSVLVNTICICDTSNGVWSNINHDDEEYYQECLSSCPTGYIPEDISKQCIEEIIPTTNPSTINISPSTNKGEQGSTTNIDIQTTTNIDIGITTTKAEFSPTENIDDISTIIDHPTPPHDNNPFCPAKYENRCYPECPEGTCLTQEDTELRTCVNINPNMQVFNGICFENFFEMTKNIKSMSDNGETITTSSGVIIHGYSTKSKDKTDEDKNGNYSLVNLVDCEYKLKTFYNLSNDTELFILGIDSPNKDPTSPVNVYNYGVYFENGTLLNHNEVCKDSKISISSPITNPDLLKLEEAEHFSELGYDIFDENSNFYNDYCASASIGGNDIILSDRKKDFYPANVSLCNDSCHYSLIDLSSKRFTCECDLSYNFSDKVTEENNGDSEDEDDTSYIEYFLSLINYKISKCYKLFLDYKSFYYNIGFYISVGTLVFCLIQIFIFSNCGIKEMNLKILENVPTDAKLNEIIKEQQKKWNSSRHSETNNNPPKNKKHEEKTKHDKKFRKTVQIKYEGDIIDKKKSKVRNKTLKLSKNHSSKKELIQSQSPVCDSKGKLKFPKQDTNNRMVSSTFGNKTNYSNISNDTFHNEGILNENIEKKELNLIPYSQALRADKRNFFQIFLSVISHEIKIISIFYYRHPLEHLSIVLSQYVFELCLDLTLNSLLYTEDVISEKYNNNGSIRFFTSLSLSFMSNIFSSIIAIIISKLSDYAEFLELIIKDITYKSKYYLNIMKFRQLLYMKLTAFFIIQTLFNLGMCYYLTIFCTVYHNTQGSIMLNYLVGIVESMIISFALTLFISIMRAVSIKCRSKSIYYTSKYFFENF